MFWTYYNMKPDSNIRFQSSAPGTPMQGGFGERGEKGSTEWSVFDAVRDDAAHAYPGSLPQRPLIIMKPGNVVRIIHPPDR